MVKIYSTVARRFSVFFVIIIIGINIFAETKKDTLVVKTQSQTISATNNKKINELYTQVEKLQQELENIKQQLSSLPQEVTETSSSLIELNHKIEKINSDIVNILQKIENLSQEISYLKRENIELRQVVETTKVSQSTASLTQPLEETKTLPSMSSKIEFNDFDILNKKIEQLKKEIEDIKEEQKLHSVSEIKDPNLRRIVTSPYFVLTTFLISIFALIAAF